MYKSIFDEVSDIFIDMDSILMNYNNNFNHIFNSLENNLNTFDSLKKEKKFSFLLESSYLIRGLLDYNYRKENNLTHYLIDKAVDINLDIYSSNFSKIDFKLDELKNSLKLEKILNYEIKNSFDSITWLSYHPRYTQNTLNNILEYKEREGITDILFISLANGSISVGIDLYLKYINETKTQESIFYPVLFSNNKLSMKKPNLNNKEKEKLINYSKNKQIIIFDEDISSGNTMSIAKDYFKSILKNEKIITFANLDY